MIPSFFCEQPVKRMPLVKPENTGKGKDYEFIWGYFEFE